MNPFRAENRWPAMIASVLLLDVAAGVALIRIANADRHFAVEPDYYRRAVAWDSTQAQARRNVALGWQLAPELGPVGPETPSRLVLRVRDRDGAPVRDATVTLEARHVAHARDALTAVLAPGAVPGEYAATLPLHRAGLWEFRVEVAASGARFTADLRLDAAPDRPAAVVHERPGVVVPAAP